MRATWLKVSVIAFLAACSPAIGERDFVNALTVDRHVALTRLASASDNKGISIYGYRRTWNDGMRMTERLVFFRDGRFVGSFYMTGTDCDRFASGMLICHGEPNSERADFGIGAIPHQIYVAGELHEISPDYSPADFGLQ